MGIGARGTGDLLLVGEAPGAEEDVAGLPFVGRAGQILDGMLSEAGLDPAHVVYTNAVRCRPPKNRKPTPAEIAACKPWLEEDVNESQPNTIVALGDSALRAVSKRSGITALRGTELLSAGIASNPGKPVLATFHPAYVARFPTKRDTVVSDLRRLRKQAELPVSDAVVYPMLDTARPEALGGVVAWDVETDWVKGNPSSGKNIIQWAASDGTRTVVGTDVGQLRSIVLAAAVPVTHNGWSFDVPKAWPSEHIPDTVWGDDTMPLAYLDEESQPLNLESLCVKYLGVDGWKEGINAEWGSPEFALYNARDAKYTYDLYTTLCTRLGTRKRVADYIIKPAFHALRQCTERGIYIDAAAVQRAKVEFEARLALACRSLELWSIENPNSPAEVAEALRLQGYKLPRTETGAYSTADGVLADLEGPLPEAIRRYRKAAKAVNSAIRPYEAITLTEDSRAHPLYLLWRTLTGRTSSRGPNVQQLARDPLLRAFFSAPAGKCFGSADYSAIEFRLAAFIAGAETVLGRYAVDPHWDPHRFVAALLYSKHEKDVTDLERQIAKSANFGLLYMAQWETLLDYTLKTTGIRLTPSQAKEIRAFWHRTFPEFRGWYQRTADLLFTQGYVESLTGRRRNIGDPSLLLRRNQAQYLRRTGHVSIPGLEPSQLAWLRECVNFQVQSFGADVALLGLSAVAATNPGTGPRASRTPLSAGGELGRSPEHLERIQRDLQPDDGHGHRLRTVRGHVMGGGYPVNGFFHDAVSFEFDGAPDERCRAGIAACLTVEPKRILEQRFGVNLTVPLTIEIKCGSEKWKL